VKAEIGEGTARRRKPIRIGRAAGGCFLDCRRPVGEKAPFASGEGEAVLFKLRRVATHGGPVGNDGGHFRPREGKAQREEQLQQIKTGWVVFVEVDADEWDEKGGQDAR